MEKFKVGDIVKIYRTMNPWADFKCISTIEHIAPIKIAKRVLQLLKKSTWRALAIQAYGIEDQMTGQHLENLAKWTLGIKD